MIRISALKMQASKTLKNYAVSCSICIIVCTVSLLCWRNIHMIVFSDVVRDRKHEALHEIKSFFNHESRTSVCRNSIQGKDLISDSRGYVCSRHSVDLTSHCCSLTKTMNQNSLNDLIPLDDIIQNRSFVNLGSNAETVLFEQFDCSSCIAADGCCQKYEYCISCCLKPENLQRYLGLYLSIPAYRKKKLLGLTTYRERPDYFDYCRHVCRTSSLSVQSENSYRGFHNYCYSQKKSTLERLSVNSDWAGYFGMKK